VTPESPGRYPARGASESSGARHTPDIADPTAVLLAEVRALKAHVAQSEGRVIAYVSSEVATIKNLATGSTHRDVEAAEAKAEATRFDMGETITKLRKQLVAAALTASIAVAGLVTRWAVGSDVAEAAAVVATDTAKEETAKVVTELAEVDTEAATAKTQATVTAARVSVLEQRFSSFETKLDDLLERLPPPKKGAR
jgi:hypothetical protein